MKNFSLKLQNTWPFRGETEEQKVNVQGGRENAIKKKQIHTQNTKTIFLTTKQL